jgi:flavin-dependent dehydrogenase
VGTTPARMRRALVGDAGYLKDPITSHGITDALRDAELLALSAVRPDHREMASIRARRPA